MNMNALPFFTVVVPLYNKHAFIERAVMSVLRQEHEDFEVIVVDDGSTDGSFEALAHLDDPRLKIVRQANAGVGAARNAGIGLARGQWMALLDADDAWWPDHLAELRRVISRFPDAGMVATACIQTTAANLPTAPRQLSASRMRKVDYFVEAARNIGFINSTCVAIRADVPHRVGLFSSHKAGEDLEYWARVALSFDVAVSERLTSAYFRVTDSAMQRLGAGQGSTMRPLAELSPSVAMLCSRAASDSTLWTNRSIQRYVNARLQSAIRGSLVQGHGAAARHYSGLLIPPFTIMDGFYKTVTALPQSVQTVLLRTYRELAQLMRRAAGKAI